MANTIKLKRSAVPGNIPTTAQLELGEVGVNTNDGKVFIKKDDGVESIVEISASENPNMDSMNGFVNRVDSTISFTEATRTFSIAPAVTDYDIWHLGTKRTISTTLSIVWSDVEGMHVFYIDANGVLQEVVPPFDIISLIENETLVSVMYWDKVNAVLTTYGDERHGIIMDSRTHAFNHMTTGSRYSFGISPTDMLTDGSGALDAHAQFAVDAGEIWDEDLLVPITAKTVTGGINIYYRTGDSLWKVEKNQTYVTYNGTILNDPVYYNEHPSEAVWQLTTVSNNKYMLMHLYATNDLVSPLGLIMGIEEYGTIAAARESAEVELTHLELHGLPSPEFKSIATFICQCSTVYGNVPNSRILTTDIGDDFIDWRFVQTGSTR